MIIWTSMVWSFQILLLCLFVRSFLNAAHVPEEVVVDSNIEGRSVGFWSREVAFTMQSLFGDFRERSPGDWLSDPFCAAYSAPCGLPHAQLACVTCLQREWAVLVTTRSDLQAGIDWSRFAGRIHRGQREFFLPKVSYLTNETCGVV